MEQDQVVISDSNRTPVVQIVTWLCLVTSTFAFMTHASIKIYTTRSLGLETSLVFVSLAFGIAQSIAVSFQAQYGFGKPTDSLQNGQLQSMFKSEYAANILFFCSIAFSKFAIVAFINSLTPKKSDRLINYGLGGFAALWLLTSVFTSAFRCPLPSAWDPTSNKCIDQLAWWDAMTIMNIVSEAAIVILEVAIMIPLQIPLPKKASVTALFTCRLFVAIAAAIQLYFYHKDSTSSLKDDFALGYWRSATSNQVVQCLAIVTTSLPYAKMFMDSSESGLYRVDDLRRRGEHSTEGSGRAYKLLEISRSRPQDSTPRQDGISTTKTFTVETNYA